MPLEKWVGGQMMRLERDSNTRCKFVVTETETWFVSLEDGAEAPGLGEMLVAATEVDLASREVVEELDGKLESGEVLLGYVSGRVVEVHSPLAVPYPTVVGRIKAVFGALRVEAPGWMLDTGKIEDEEG